MHEKTCFYLINTKMVQFLFPIVANRLKILEDVFSHDKDHMSCIMRKSDFHICENKGADQLCSNCAADQRLCFRYIDGTILLLPKSEISSL